jgi:hypothetical protein
MAMWRITRFPASALCRYCLAGKLDVIYDVSIMRNAILAVLFAATCVQTHAANLEPPFLLVFRRSYEV